MAATAAIFASDATYAHRSHYTAPAPAPAPALAPAPEPVSTPTSTPAPTATTANNYYVATTGSDANSGTQAAPFRTLKKAASVVQPDTTVHVAPGTYAETILTTVSGTPSGRIRYVSDTKWGAKIVPADGAITMWQADGGYTDIDGFQIDGTGGTGTRQGVYLSGGNSAVMNSWVHHVAESSGCDSYGGAGLLAAQGRGADFNNYDFTGNLIHDIGGSCEFIQGIYHSSSGSVKNNIVYATNYGIHLYHDDHNIDVLNNTVFGNRWFGIVYGGCTSAYNNGCPTSGVNIHNNIIYDNRGGIQGPISSEDGNNALQNNLVYGNSINVDMSSQALAQSAGMISADPQFVNYIRAGGGDYRLKSTSPAIGMGASN